MRVGRHRHAINVRADGLGTVLGPLMQDAAVQAALLVDIDSGMVLDACGPIAVDQEQLGAAHGDLMRLALGPAAGMEALTTTQGGCEIVVSHGDDRHLVLRRVPDQHGDRLALSVLVSGPPRALRRTRRRLREVSAMALTAGPTVSLRPVEGAWVPGVPQERPIPQARPYPPVRSIPGGPVSGQVSGLAPATSDGGPARGNPTRGNPATGDPVGGPALAALDARVPPAPRRRSVLEVLPELSGVLPLPLRPVPEETGPPQQRPAPHPSRPAPPSALPPAALPPPALREGGGR
jgi:hypothetical protein